MQDRIRIRDLPSRANEQVTVLAWVMTTRFSGKIGFVVVRDGTGYLQIVVSKNEVGDALWESVRQLTQETSVEVTGTVRPDARSPGGVELGLKDLRVLGASADFPI